jgi:hypothetical protein
MQNVNFAEGLEILGKYLDPEKYDLAAEHDIFLVALPKDVSGDDEKELLRLGWFRSKEFDDCWGAFV